MSKILSAMKFVVLCCIFGIGFAYALSSFFALLNPNVENTDNDARVRPQRSPKSWPRIGDTPQNIFWIVQVSDIHISMYRDLARAPDMERFCEEYIGAIKPALVLITGDLVDAKMPMGIESRQNHDEWVMYENVISRCRAFSKAPILDLRGNHDAFDVFDYKSKNNYYRWHSARGKDAQKISDSENGYIHNLHFPFGQYSFIGIDSISRPGPNRPFNFFGYLDDKQLQHLRSLASSSRQSNHTVWFGHFPTSLIVHDPPSSVRQIMSQSIAYVCGHLHTLMNYVPKMYSKHKTGQLELELGDWKENRIFRVMAFDHDLLSFTDAKLGQWPLIIVTNPKDNQFFSAKQEPVEMISSSTHIRILVFSPVKIWDVAVLIDGHLEGYAKPAVAHNKSFPLWMLKWQPDQYAHGMHFIKVIATDENGKNASVSHKFSVNGDEIGFPLLPRLLLMLNIYSLGKVVYSLLVFFYVLFLTSLRQCTYIRHCFCRGQGFLNSFINSWIMKLWLAARASVSYYILIGSVLYLTFGPWFIGLLLSDKIGVVFVWGIIIENNFISGGITYFYGIFQFMTFTVPLTLILGHLLDTRRKHGNRMLFFHHVFIWTPSIMLGLFTAYVALTEFPKAYGQRTILLGPLRSGSLFLLPISLWLAYRTDLKHILAINGPA